MREMELIRAGVDSQGDEFTTEELRGVVERFNRPLPVLLGFDMSSPPVGRVTALRLNDNRVMAAVEIENSIADGLELAVGGHARCEIVRGGVRRIEQFDLTHAGLVANKVTVCPA